MNSITVIILCVIVVTLQQQQCPIGQLSLDRKKCIYTIAPLSIAKNYFDAERDCEQIAQISEIPNDQAFLVTIPNAFENGDTISRW